MEEIDSATGKETESSVVKAKPDDDDAPSPWWRKPQLTSSDVGSCRRTLC